MVSTCSGSWWGGERPDDDDGESHRVCDRDGGDGLYVGSNDWKLGRFVDRSASSAVAG